MTHTAMEWPQETVAQCVAAVIGARRSVRAFKPEPLRQDIVEAILRDAATARAARTSNRGACMWSPARSKRH